MFGKTRSGKVTYEAGKMEPGWRLVFPIENRYFIHCYVSLPEGTLPETNIAPENRPLEKEIPIGNQHF